MEHGCGDKRGLSSFCQLHPAPRGLPVQRRVPAHNHPAGAFTCAVLQLARALMRRTPQGLLRDNHFLMTTGLEAVWAGSRNRKSDDN